MRRRDFIKTSAVLGSSTFLLSACSSPISFIKSGELDLIIKNGKIIDGTGKQAFTADVGIKDGRIVEIGNLKETSASNIIDAKNLCVSPGFIDIHSHTDVDLFINPKAESKIRQGVTTEVAGQDGESWGPIANPENKKLESFRADYNEELSWRTLGEFLGKLLEKRFSVNLASMIGLGTVREFIVGLDDRPAGNSEMDRMRKEVLLAIQQGAIGVSTGLEYTPGSFASTEELIELCKAVPKEFRLYSTHMRNEDNTVLEAIDEAIKIAKDSDARLLISHLKVSGKSNWHKAEAALEKIDNAIKEGLEVHADRYTYVAYHTSLANLFPLWSRDGGTEKFIAKLKDNSLKKQLQEFAEKKVSNLDGGWNGILISGIGKKEFKGYQGKTVEQIGKDLDLSSFDAAVKIILDSENNVLMVGFGMEEKSTEAILAHPRVMIASDAGAHAPYPPMTRNIAHPRAYGTFPRAIAKYVRERNICSLEEMIRKMTSMPADKLGLKNIGRIEKGKNADLVIFDYNRIRDKATFIEPHQYPDGIPYVIVNGVIVIKENEHTGEMPGKIIRSGNLV